MVITPEKASKLVTASIGGHPENVSNVENFKGCISQLKINSKTIEIAPSKVKAIGTETCQICDKNADCLNGGFCQETYNSVGHVCLCLTDFSGIMCERKGQR